MKKHFLLLVFLLFAAIVEAANPVKQMLERLQEGLSDRFKMKATTLNCMVAGAKSQYVPTIM